MRIFYVCVREYLCARVYVMKRYLDVCIQTYSCVCMCVWVWAFIVALHGAFAFNSELSIFFIADLLNV